MTYPNEHTYVSVIGDAYGGTERWQFGFRLQPEVVGREAVALALAPHIEAWWRSTAPPYQVGSNEFGSLTSHRLTELKVATIGVDGLYPPDEPAYSHFYLPPIVGGRAPGAGVVPQATIAVGLTTAVPRGLASKGRVYLPPCRWIEPQADGKIPAAGADAVRDSFKILINAINNDPLVGNVAIFSRGRGVPSYNAEKKRVEYDYPNPGAVHLVTGVRVGRVVDTQRRRRRQLDESYEVAQL